MTRVGKDFENGNTKSTKEILPQMPDNSFRLEQASPSEDKSLLGDNSSRVKQEILSKEKSSVGAQLSFSVV